MALEMFSSIVIGSSLGERREIWLGWIIAGSVELLNGVVRQEGREGVHVGLRVVLLGEMLGRLRAEGMMKVVASCKASKMSAGSHNDSIAEIGNDSHMQVQGCEGIYVISQLTLSCRVAYRVWPRFTLRPSMHTRPGG